MTLIIDDTGKSHYLMRESRKRKWNEIEDDEKEELKKEIDNLKNAKYELEIEVLALRTELERIDDEGNNMN